MAASFNIVVLYACSCTWRRRRRPDCTGPSPCYVTGPAAALSEVDQLADVLGDYHLFHATRAEHLRAVGRPDEARKADQLALERTTNPAEQSLLRQCIAWA